MSKIVWICDFHHTGLRRAITIDVTSWKVCEIDHIIQTIRFRYGNFVHDKTLIELKNPSYFIQSALNSMHVSQALLFSTSDAL